MAGAESWETDLALRLRDATNAVWSSNELTELIDEAVYSMWPRVGHATHEDVTLLAATETYTLATVAEVSRIDLLDANGLLLWPLQPGTWELRDWDYQTAGGTLFVNRWLSLNGTSLRVHGYAPIAPTDATIPLRYKSYILARAGTEAIRRMFGDRAKFTQWMATAQEQNVSPIEFSVLMSNWENEADRLYRQLRTWRKPVPATV